MAIYLSKKRRFLTVGVVEPQVSRLLFGTFESLSYLRELTIARLTPLKIDPSRDETRVFQYRLPQYIFGRSLTQRANAPADADDIDKAIVRRADLGSRRNRNRGVKIDALREFFGNFRVRAHPANRA